MWTERTEWTKWTGAGGVIDENERASLFGLFVTLRICRHASKSRKLLVAFGFFSGIVSRIHSEA